MISSKNEDKYLFNPFEIAFCGFSGSGKTTLICQLLKKFSDSINIGYVKHDAHKFEMDYEGKDTNKAYLNGASGVFINDKEHNAYIAKGNIDFLQQKTIMLEYDWVFIEGYKNSTAKKILFINSEEINNYNNIEEDFKNIIAFIGEDESKPTNLNTNKPYFNRNEIEKIADFIKNTMEDEGKKIPLYGLVLSGGYSTRMSKDKSTLNYHGKPQYQITADLLSNFCEKTFISSREDQKDKFENYEVVSDVFKNFGPMGGILSAMSLYPKLAKKSAWLVLACDLPYLKKEDLEIIVKNRNVFRNSTVYINDGMPEPLCAIYEPKIKTRMLGFLAQGYSCPRKVLINSAVEKITLENTIALTNVNHSEEYTQALNYFNPKGE
ncbi:MAG: molybdopterin-guanine dinucleotide biosynthesis protein B [Cyanobacteriota bacterium]